MELDGFSGQIASETPSQRAADLALVEQVRQGSGEAGDQFFHENHPAVYRYLLWLTQRPETAEDLAQETFVRAWRHLERYDGRAPLRAWLHRIAHREFLRFLRDQRTPVPLEAIGEVAAPGAGEQAEAVELHAVVGMLPVEEREVVVLHYLQGYDCREIARIVGAPVGTVKYRLWVARDHLRRELGEGDLQYLNGAAVRGPEGWVPAVGGGRRIVDGDASGGAGMSAESHTGISRRELLGAAGAAAAAMAAAGLAGAATAAPANEGEIVDERLACKVTLAAKGVALGDLCAQLVAETGIGITAGPSVADEKVTLFCEKRSVREVMRQLSRPFGYTWVRSKRVSGEGGRVSGADDPSPTPHTLPPTPSAEYRYELMQDLRSQLMEEELRNRERNAALLALERELEPYRGYLDLSPEAALERAKTAPPAEKQRLEQYAGPTWGLVQLYFRLSPGQQAALRAGQPLLFSPAPGPGQFLLPPELGRGVLASQRDTRLRLKEKGFEMGSAAGFPEGLPLTQIPEARPVLSLIIGQTDLGQLTMAGGVGYAVRASPGQPLGDWQEAVASMAYGNGGTFGVGDPGIGYMIAQVIVATGRAPAAEGVRNEVANARLAREAALRRRVSVEAQGSCGADLSPGPSPTRGGGAQAEGGPHDASATASAPPSLVGKGDGGLGLPDLSPGPSPTQGGGAHPQRSSLEPNPPPESPPSLVGKGAGGLGSENAAPEHKCTSADVLEALHRATGMPIVADFYTRLYEEESVSVRDAVIFEALNRVGDALRMRWHQEAGTREVGGWLQFRSARYYDDRLREVPNRLLARWAASRRRHGLLTPDALCEIAQLPDAALDSAEMAEGAKECWGLKAWDLARTRHLRAHLRFLAELGPEQRWEALRPAGLSFSRLSLPQQQQFVALALGARASVLQVGLADLASAVLRVEYRVPGDRLWAAGEQPDVAPQLVPRAPMTESRRQSLLENARRFHDQRPEEELLKQWQPEWDLAFTYTIGSGAREIRRRADIHGGGLHLPDE